MSADMSNKNQVYTRLRRRAHRLAKQQGIEFPLAFDQSAQAEGFTDAVHAIKWCMQAWGPVDPPSSTPARHVARITT